MVSRPLIASLCSVTAAMLPTLMLLGWPLMTPTTFAFRDAGHFYFPLYRWINSAPLVEPPLWNPYDNLGVPVADEATSALFYPGRILLHAPVESFAVRFELYILFHGLLAAGGAWLLARSWRLSHPAAILAGMSYGCAGAVLFQYCNVVFLVGAGWLPFVLAAGWKMLRSGKWRWSLPASSCLALMILGGDAQTAYVAVIALGLAVVFRKRAWRAVLRLFVTRTGRLEKLIRPFAQLGLMAVLAGVLAAPQVVASFQAARESPRFIAESPRSLWEVAESRVTGERPLNGVGTDLALLAAPPLANSHHDVSYDFSVAPWHWAEFVWPRFSGSLFPIHRRWTADLPSEDRVWTPTLYLGLFPFVLAFAAFWSRIRSAKTRWLRQLAGWGLVTALGWYGVGWLANEAWHSLGGLEQGEEAVAGGFGGLYWIQSILLPGFVGFRYPAKFLVVASLAISMLAATGYDQLSRPGNRRPTITLVGVAIASLVLLATVLSVACFGQDWFAKLASADESFGPFDAFGAMLEVAGSAGWALLLAMGCLWMIRLRTQMPPYRFAAIMLFATMVDLAVSQQNLIALAPEASFDHRRHPESSYCWTDFQDAKYPLPVDQRRQRFGHEFAEESSPDRIDELVIAERSNLFGRHNLPAEHPRGILMANTFLSVRSANYLAFIDAVRSNSESPAAPLRRMVGWLPDEPTTHNRPDIFPLAFSVNHVDCFALLHPKRPAKITERTAEMLFPSGGMRDFETSASVETRFPDDFSPTGFAPAEVTLDALAPAVWQLNVESAETGFVVLRQSYDPDWRVSATSRTDGHIVHPEIQRTNRILQGFMLPPGSWRVRVEYQPRGLFIAGWIAFSCWIITTLLAIGVPVISFIAHRKEADS